MKLLNGFLLVQLSKASTCDVTNLELPTNAIEWRCTSAGTNVPNKTKCVLVCQTGYKPNSGNFKSNIFINSNGKTYTVVRYGP